MSKDKKEKLLGFLLAIEEPMETLDLHSLGLESKHVGLVCSLIIKHSDTLKAVTLANNDLRGRMYYVLQFLSMCNNLETLDIVDNNIDDGSVWTALSSFIKKKTTLVNLYIGARMVPEAVGIHSYYDFDLRKSAEHAGTKRIDDDWYFDEYYGTGFNEIKRGDQLLLEDAIKKRYRAGDYLADVYFISTMRSTTLVCKRDEVYSFDRSIDILQDYDLTQYGFDEYAKDLVSIYTINPPCIACFC